MQNTSLVKKNNRYQCFAKIKCKFEETYNSSVKFSDAGKNNQFFRLQNWRQDTLRKDLNLKIHFRLNSNLWRF